MDTHFEVHSCLSNKNCSGIESGFVLFEQAEAKAEEAEKRASLAEKIAQNQANVVTSKPVCGYFLVALKIAPC